MNKQAKPAMVSALQKTAYFLLSFLLFAAALEFAARVMDSRYQIRYRALQILSMLESRTTPVTAQDDLPWPDKSIYIRAPEPHERKDEIYTVGGKVIPGGHEKLKIRRVSPQDFQADRNKKIFIIGESAAFGFPYLYTYSFGSVLNDMLKGQNYTVINAAQIATPSGRLCPLVRRIVDYYQPDTLIIFAGNNEWMNWAALPQNRILGKFLAAFRAMSGSRLMATAIFYGFKWKSTQRPANGKFSIHKEIEGFEYALDNPFEIYYRLSKSDLLYSKRLYIKTFEDNLTGMVRYARRKNIRVILMNLPFNYKLSPAWNHPQPETFLPGAGEKVAQAIHQAAAMIQAGNYRQALPVLAEAIRLDPLPPMLHYLSGYALERTGRPLEAEAEYALSRENMIGHLGARLSINRAIAEVSLATGTEMVDLQRIFDEREHALGGFFNSHLIDDDCHPNPHGNRLIAESLYPLFQK